MTYKINGVDLDNKEQGWTFVRGSIPVSGLEFTSTSLDVPGMDGTVFLPSTRRPVSFSFVIKSPLVSRNNLLMLMGAPRLEITDSDRPGQVAHGRLLSSTVDEYHAAKGWAKDNFLVEVPSGCWRGPSITTIPTPAQAGGATHSVFSNLSATVQDGIVKITGPVQNPEVLDIGSNSYFRLAGTVAGGSELRFNLASNRAWIHTGSSSVEVSGNISFGGPRGGFELTPVGMTGAASLRLTATSYGAGATISVTAQPAYLF